MSEKQAKAAFLKQAKPFLKRYETERTRKNKRQMKTTGFKASITPSPAPFFVAEHEDIFRGRMTMRVPILFTLPPGFAAGRKFTDAADFANFKKYCEGK